MVLTGRGRSATKARRFKFRRKIGAPHGAFLRADRLRCHPRHRVFAVEQQTGHPLAHGRMGPRAADHHRHHGVERGADRETFAPIALPLERYGAAILFIVLAIVVYQIAVRMPLSARRPIWYAFGVVSLYLFLTFNLLAYLFERLKDIVNNLMSYTAEGSKFVFGPLGDPANPVLIFATRVLPTIIFIASIFAVLYYVGVMQVVVRFFAKLMTRFMGVSGAESTSVAASIFMGQTEAPLTIRPFLPDMTMSELMTIMTAGMAHVSGAIMAAYVMIAKVDVIHLLTAVIMTAPGAIMMAKIIVPEVEQPKTGGDVEVVVPKQDVNVIDAAGRGAIEGLHLSLNVAGMLIAFIALVALVNGIFHYVHTLAVWFPD